MLSLVIPTFNAEAHLATTLERVKAADEIIVVDGGSSDGTLQLLQQAAEDGLLRIISAPGTNIAQGRNLAIESAQGDIIAVTDAGTRADPRWLRRLVDALADPLVDVAAGFFVPELDNRWDRALAAATLPDALEIDPKVFLPSSRSVAFRAGWYRAGVRYPEWLDYCEDLVWDLALQRAGARFQFVLDAVVAFRVRPDPRAYALQYFRYARGDGKAGLFARRHALRFLTYGGLLIVLLRRRPLELGATGLLGAAYVAPLVRRLWRRDRRQRVPLVETLADAPLVVALRALGDIAKMAGYPIGLYWRWRRYGTLGWRATWRRISPCGELWHPGSTTRGNRRPRG